MLTKRVHICPYSSSEKGRLLGYDTQTGPQVMETYCSNINPINKNATACRFHQPEKGTDKSCFSGTRATHNTDSMSSTECARYALKDQRCSWPVSNLHENPTSTH